MHIIIEYHKYYYNYQIGQIPSLPPQTPLGGARTCPCDMDLFNLLLLYIYILVLIFNIVDFLLFYPWFLSSIVFYVNLCVLILFCLFLLFRNNNLYIYIFFNKKNFNMHYFYLFYHLLKLFPITLEFFCQFSFH